MCHGARWGYQPHEPHGYLTGDYPNGGVWSPMTAQAGAAEPRGLCGFRLWRTPAGYGKPDAGVCVVLCCKGCKASEALKQVQQAGASRTEQPEA